MKSCLTLKLITVIYLTNRIKEKIVWPSQQMQKVNRTKLNPYSWLNSQEIRNGGGQLKKGHGVRCETIVSGQETTCSSTLPTGSVLCSAGDGRWSGGHKNAWEGIRNSSFGPWVPMSTSKTPHAAWSITSGNSYWTELAVFFIMLTDHTLKPHAYLRSLGTLPWRPIPNSQSPGPAGQSTCHLPSAPQT